MKDIFSGLLILAIYYAVYLFFLFNYGQKYPMLATVFGVFPWIYLVIASEKNQFSAIFYALFWTTILIYLGRFLGRGLGKSIDLSLALLG